MMSKFPLRVFSGIQPTGNGLHIGNYFGAVSNWVRMQDQFDTTIYSIVDLHAITMEQPYQEIRNRILVTAATLIACGIDPQKSILFQQSKVPHHGQMSWILSCITSMNYLGRLPQYKEKKKMFTKGAEIPLGLYTYPVLQAADILLYRATHVPVGEDQIHHLQLAQHLSRKFNSTFHRECFPRPEALIPDEHSKRVKNLRDPGSKMSKSAQNPNSRIDLLDPPEVVKEKIKKALTDFTSAVTWDPEGRAGVANLISIHSLLTKQSAEEIVKEAGGMTTHQYKLALGEIAAEKLGPIRERILELLEDRQKLEDYLDEGAKKATSLAETTWHDIESAVGFSNRTK